MVSPAAALLAAYNGKTSNPGTNYGGYNPFAGNASASPTGDIGQQAQEEVAQSQSNYFGQQSLNRSQLAANLQPYSVGGQVQQNAGGTQQVPGSNNAFSDAINAITQRGVNATAAQQSQQQSYWSQRFNDLTSQFQKNSSGANDWLQRTIQGIQAQTQNGASSGFDQLGQLIPTGADPNNRGAQAVAIAKAVAAKGVPYVWGGNSLTQGVDCSGLVQQVYARLGIQLPRTSTEQAKYGKVVPSLSQALPGDLILMYSPYEPAGLQQYGHVGIYIGNGQMVEAPGTGKNVRIAPIWNMTKIVRPW